MAPPRALTYVWYVALLLLSYTHAAREEPVGGIAVASPPYDNPTAMQSMGNTPHTGLPDDYVKVRGRSPALGHENVRTGEMCVQGLLTE
jgi:hypothetical protein